MNRSPGYQALHAGSTTMMSSTGQFRGGLIVGSLGAARLAEGRH